MIPIYSAFQSQKPDQRRQGKRTIQALPLTYPRRSQHLAAVARLPAGSLTRRLYPQAGAPTTDFPPPPYGRMSAGPSGKPNHVQIITSQQAPCERN